MKTLFLSLSFVGLMCATKTIQAAEIQGVTIYNYSSQNFAYPSSATYSVTNLVTSTGLWGDFHTFGGAGSMWLSTNGPSGTNYVTFNLGGLYTVNAIKVWNFNDYTTSSHLTYGVSNASISYSTDGTHFTTSIASQNFNEAPGTFYGYPQTISLPSPVSAQYIRININTNWGGGTAGVGLAKVRFISDTNPPAVLSASENFGSNQVTVIFSESINPGTATNPANYSISGSGPAVTISSAAMGEYPDRVILYTGPLTGSGYTVSVSGVYDEAVTAAVTNNSTVAVQPELYLWLRADQGVTTTPAGGGNMVTTWADQSSYGHNAVAPASFFNSSMVQPFLVNDVVNGKPAVQFSGTNVLQIPNDAANPINGDLTIVAVVACVTTSGSQEIINKVGGGSTAAITNNLAAPFDFYFGSGEPDLYVGNNGGLGNELSGKQAITANTFYVVAATVTATNLCQAIIDGASPLSNDSVTPINDFSAFQPEVGAPADGGNPITIGARNSNPVSDDQPLNGYLPEVMLIRGTITPSDLTNIEDYLAAKYAIAPVAITEQPASLTASAGSQATFWVGASGMQPFSYQWQSNGVDIAGATGRSYTTPYLTSSANNASYTVTVSDASGTANSTAATLTVVTPTTPPTVNSAVKSAGLTSVSVIFSEAVDPTTSQNAADYSINGGVSVTSVAAGSSANQVVLTVSGMTAAGLYSLNVQNVKDQYGNAIVSAVAPIMPSTMTMWLKADSGVVTNPATGSTVDAWLDQTANGNNAQTYGIGPSYRPSLTTDSVSQKPAVLFNASSENFLVVPSSPGLALTHDFTFYIVADIADFSTYRSLIGKDDQATYCAPYEFYCSPTSGQLNFFRGDGTSYHNGAQKGSDVPVGQPTVLDIMQQGTTNNSGGTGYDYQNGGSPASIGFVGYNYDDWGENLYIAGRQGMGLHLNGNIAEIMVFSNAISAYDRTNIDNYLGGKYFTLANTLPLLNVTNNAGNMQTFTVLPSQGSAHLTYQWVENGTNITGATGSSYTTGPLYAGDNGDTFSVDVIVPGVSTNVLGLSNSVTPVTLTVVSVPPSVVDVGSALWVSTTNTLIVDFSETVNPAFATNSANYDLNNGATVLSAVLWSPTEVLLTTSTLNNPPYTLTIKNVESTLGAVMTTTNWVNAAGTLYPPALALWLRADEGVSTNSDGTVASWNDQSGNGNNFAGTSGFEPAFVANAANGLPALLFNATNETYLYDGSPSMLLQCTNDMTIFAVMNFTTYANPSGALAEQGGGEIISLTDPNNLSTPAPFDYYVYYPSGDNVPIFLRGDGQGGNGSFVGASSSPSTGAWHELSAMMNPQVAGSATIYHRLDGHQNGSPTWSGTIAYTGGSLFIGTREDGNVRLTGYMAELIVVDSALSTNDYSAIETYLGTKYGILSSQPIGVLSSNSTAVVYWQKTGWYSVLQSTPSLNPAVWTTVTNPVVSIGTTNMVSVPMTNQMFYRLKFESQ